MKYGIGLDIGIASVGWAVVALDGQEMPCGILGMGARVFNTASLAVDRRKERGTRRRFRRHRHRNARIRALFLDSGLLSKEELDTLFNGHLEDIYALRVRALDEPITRTEFARVLIHLSQRRGFKSNRKNSAPKKDGELLKGLKANEDRVKNAKYRTVGEMFLKDDTFRVRKRNKGDHLTSVSREQVEIEVRAIFSAQRQMGSAFASKEFEDKYTTILLSQRSFDEGPGGNSLYAGNQIEKMVGICTFFHKEGEPRAAKATYSFEYFSLLEKVNHIRLIRGGESIPLTEDQRRQLIALAHETENLDFTIIRKKLSIPPDYTFNVVRYETRKKKGSTDTPLDMESCEKGTKFKHLQAYHQFRKGLGKEYWSNLSISKRNAVASILTKSRVDKTIRELLQDEGFSSAEIDNIVNSGLSFSGYGHLSLKALAAITPHLELGMGYVDACSAANLPSEVPSTDKTEQICLKHACETYNTRFTSPVARRSISQAFKVINAIIKKYGHSPIFVNIELSREMSKSAEERDACDKENRTREKENNEIRSQLMEYGISDPKPHDVVKFRFWREQDGRCMYSGEPIELRRLAEPGYAEIDHIVPYSKSTNNSNSNKVLVLARENRVKGDRLPLEYLTGEKRASFIIRVNQTVKNQEKKLFLLKESITSDEEEGFIERNTVDTRSITRFVMNYLRNNLLFEKSTSGRIIHVMPITGYTTSYLRTLWGIKKERNNGDQHHAVDALVIACSTRLLIDRVRYYSRWRERKSLDFGKLHNSSGPQYRFPWPLFRKELEEWVPSCISGNRTAVEGHIFVSRMPTRKVTGAAHKDTIKSPRELDEGYVIVKRALTDLKLKNGEIENYYNPNSDRLLYEALKARLAQFGGDGKKAFAQPFHKPKSDGTDGPVVNKVKLCEPTTLNVAVHGGKGVADNDSMVRVDVFYVEDDGYYLVPIYVADTLKPELPKRACVAGKSYEQWKEMRDEDFIFSLYPNDLIFVERKKIMVFKLSNTNSTLQSTQEVYSGCVYYRGTDIATASIKCTTHDNAYEYRGLGVKTLGRLEKYTVDVLGEYHPVGKETRQGFTRKK